MKGLTLANRYEIVEKIGEGGMAFVYKAKDLKLNRLVAVKILRSEFASDKDFLEKFKDEAMSAASINDSNIVSIYDVGSEDSLNYIVMEYINGKTLKELISERGALPYKEVIDISTKIAKALDSAHKNNIVHRDVKPHNILVTEKGDIKVTDFGIAKGNSSATIVNTNRVIGSVHYISPEQAKGSIVDRRSDLYSLGVVMYEMATGKLPFDGESPVSIAIKHIQEQVIEPKKININIPESLNYLILKALEKDPVLRYQNAHDLYIDLLNIKNGTFVAAEPKKEEQTIFMKPIDSTMINLSKDKFRKIEDEEEQAADEVIVSRSKDNRKNLKKTKKILITTVALVGFILLAMGTFYIGSLFANAGNDEVVVPNVIKLTEDEAKKKIQEAGLKYEVAEVSNNDLDAGLIYATSPQVSTRVKKDSTVKVYISAGVPTNTVDNFEKMDLETAKTIIKNNGFTLGKVEEAYSDSIPQGQIISQSPSANTDLEKGGIINLVVSKGSQYSSYNLVGKTVDEAKAMIAGSDINLSVNLQNSSNDADQSKDGKIIDQDKTKVKNGDTITVTVIKYTQATITIDSSKVTGVQLSSAKSYLSGLGLNTKVVYKDDKDKKLSDDKLLVKEFTSNPDVNKGDTITLVVVKKSQ